MFEGVFDRADNENVDKIPYFCQNIVFEGVFDVTINKAADIIPYFNQKNNT